MFLYYIVSVTIHQTTDFNLNNIKIMKKFNCEIDFLTIQMILTFQSCIAGATLIENILLKCKSFRH